MRLIPCYFLLYRRTYVDNIYTFVEVCRHIYLENRYFWTGTLAGCMLYTDQINHWESDGHGKQR